MPIAVPNTEQIGINVSFKSYLLPFPSLHNLGCHTECSLLCSYFFQIFRSTQRFPMSLGLLPPPTCVSVFSIASFLVKLLLQLILIQTVHHKEAKISKDKSLPSCSSLPMNMNANKIRAVTL